MRRIRFAIAGAAMLCAAAILPAAASADCNLPTGNGGSNNTALSGGTTQTFSGHFGPDLNGKFIQIPFDVGSGITGMKIRYCYAKATGGEADDSPTLDLGVYDAKPAEATTWTQAERRGWSGSALRTIGIGVNGYSDPATYEGGRKNYVPGRTTRAFKPGPIEAGQWAVEFGAGWIDPDGAGVDWKLEVITSTAPEWSNDAFTADPYAPYSANPNPGWYTGDLHAHGEMEPGNATMKQTMDLGFGALPAGNGLDFMTVVDHNNSNSLGVLGEDQYSYPGKLVIPGIEVTTYNGHWNAIGSSNFADFRFSDVLRWDDAGDDNIQTDGELSTVRPAIQPASQMQPILDGGGYTQVNHPETLKAAPAQCRGCAWTYSDAQTDWSKVTALEIQNGPAGIPAGSPTAMNPFSVDAIKTYERLLADGFHIAAVGSSDDHQGGEATGAFDSPVGRGATVVHADQLSTQGVIDAVKAGHTYVKPFGADAPDVELSASTPQGGKAIPGDSVTGSSLAIKIAVEGAASAVRPGPYTLKLLQDGIEVDSVTVTGDSYSHTFNVSESGRYGFELTRPLGDQTMIEAYSTPVWFTFKKPSNTFSFGAYKANRAKGTATLKVKVVSPGSVKLTGPGLNNASAKVTKANQTVTLNLKPKAALKKQLKKKGSAKVKVKVTNTPTGGSAASKSKTVKLLGKKAKKKKRH